MMDARRGHKRRRYLRIDRSRVVPYVLVVTNKNPSVLTSAIDQVGDKTCFFLKLAPKKIKLIV